jgi:DNA-binding response OmpR family regulator
MALDPEPMTIIFPAAAPVDLNGINVLVVEDDYFIADEICSLLRRCDAVVVGPAGDTDRGLQLLDQVRVDCAVLDINLRGTIAFDLANELRRRRVPLIFATGYDEAILPAPLAGSVRLEKPIDLNALLEAVKMSTRGAAPAVSN